jgi:glycosyltransferase involved in cell wall biosynthesis
MYLDKKIAVVVPCYNESELILETLKGVPDYVDKTFVVDDGSVDNTVQKIESYIEGKDNFALIKHESNKGLGNTIRTGYQVSHENDYEITIIMAGDNQMDPQYLPDLLKPIISLEYDYSKGNRLGHKETNKMPLFRRFGNSILSLITKISTGYWSVIDPQNGYTAISRTALDAVLDGKISGGYGYNSDILCSLNIHNFRVKDVSLPPVYKNETSGIKIGRYMVKTSWILLSGFFRRIHSKYGGLRFHPLLLYYYSSFIFGSLSILLASRMIYMKYYVDGFFPLNTTLATFFSVMATIQFLLFAFWMDMQEGER